MDPSNYRGITINSTVGKIFEAVCLERLLPTFRAHQSRLQRGFTQQVSPMNASILLTETVNEYRDKHQTVVATFLDIEKAFDVVWIDGLLHKLYQLNIPRSLWITLAQWYRGLSATVKWNNMPSYEFSVAQGTGQGRIFSPEFFKVFSSNPLKIIENLNCGATIGHIEIPAIVFADDSTILSDSPMGQELLDIFTHDGHRQRYKFGANKTKTIVYESSKQQPGQVPMLKMQGTDLQPSKEATHMGIIHSADPKKVLNARRVANSIKSARGALYALFGAGMHGKKGLTPPICKQLWQIYICPILTYGAETWQMAACEYEPMELFQRKSLRALQSLPDNTANVATLGLLGLLPVQMVVESKALNLLVALLRDRESLEYDIAIRQLAVKDNASNSWFIFIQGLLFKYQLPTAHDLIQELPSKTLWKATVRQAVIKLWTSHCRSELLTKSSLKYMSPHSLNAEGVAPVWDTARDCPTESFKAAVKVKVLTGTYRTQACRAKFNQNKADPTCCLCGAEAEDVAHFLLRCPTLAKVRKPYLDKLLDDSTHLKLCLVSDKDGDLLTQCLLDANHPLVPDIIRNSRIEIQCLEQASSDLISALHVERWRLLQALCSKNQNTIN